jgi:hypothetical protein
MILIGILPRATRKLQRHDISHESPGALGASHPSYRADAVLFGVQPSGCFHIEYNPKLKLELRTINAPRLRPAGLGFRLLGS